MSTKHTTQELLRISLKLHATPRALHGPTTLHATYHATYQTITFTSRATSLGAAGPQPARRCMNQHDLECTNGSAPTAVRHRLGSLRTSIRCVCCAPAQPCARSATESVVLILAVVHLHAAELDAEDALCRWHLVRTHHLARESSAVGGQPGLLPSQPCAYRR